MSKVNKPKLPTIKSLRNKVWKECVRIVRSKHIHTCISCGKENLEGKDLQAGHLFREKFLPFQMKLDLRLLRPQCINCNLYRKGNEAWFATNLIRQEGADYLLKIAEDIEFYEKEELDTAQKREFLIRLLAKYKEL
jgi:predicted nucleic-acid-binding Zn-ribbon protein